MLFRRIVISAVVGTLWVGVPLSAQQRANLPPPDSSRPPRLTKMSSDSIRYQTALLHLAELLQALQAGDATTGSALLRDATLSLAGCGGIAEAISRATAQVRKTTRSDGGTSLALFFDKIVVENSGTTQIVTADLVVMLKTSGVPKRISVRLVLDAERGLWSAESGLMNGLCSL